MKAIDYWEECVSLGVEACEPELKLSPNEVTSIAESVPFTKEVTPMFLSGKMAKC